MKEQSDEELARWLAETFLDAQKVPIRPTMTNDYIEKLKPLLSKLSLIAFAKVRADERGRVAKAAFKRPPVESCNAVH